MRNSAEPIPSDDLQARIRACRICAERFAATATRHSPRPVVWFGKGTRIVIAGQAPGMRVHQEGRPFWDASGKRLRDWLGLSEAEFYDRSRISVVPMAFCFPGYDSKGSDLPPPKVCSATWHDQVAGEIGTPALILPIGAYAHRWYLGRRTGGVSATVAGWRQHAPRVFPLPHPSWRNTGWLKRNPWFESELLPVLRQRVREIMGPSVSKE